MESSEYYNIVRILVKDTCIRKRSIDVFYPFLSEQYPDTKPFGTFCDEIQDFITQFNDYVEEGRDYCIGTINKAINQDLFDALLDRYEKDEYWKERREKLANRQESEDVIDETDEGLSYRLMKHCRHCGRTILKKVEYCPYCGNPQKELLELT